MTATAIDLSAIKSDVLSSAANFRQLIGLGSSATLNAGSANGVATLGADSKLTAAQIPDISLISYLGSVASQSAMLALSGQQGDWCVRSDLSTTWVITGSDPTLLANWTQLSYPSVPVQSVHGRTGAVVGVSTDYSSVGITNTAIGASNPSTGAFTTLSANSATLSAGTLNGTVLDIAQTWGGTGTYTGLRYNVTDSGPSNAASLLMDLQVGGTTRLALDKNGWLRLRDSSYSLGVIASLANVPYMVMSTAQLYLNTSISLSNNNPVNGPDIVLTRDAAGILAQRNGTNAQTFRLYRTADGSPGSNYERLALSSMTYSGGVYNTILCETAGTGADNINLVLGPAGTGAILAQVPDGTATGGNARGANAVDLQLSRTANTQVANASYSVISGGQNNTASGDYSGVHSGANCSATGPYSSVFGYACSSTNYYSLAAGHSCTSSNFASVALGFAQTASGSCSVAIGGESNTASAYAAYGMGVYASANRQGLIAVGSGRFASAGDAQSIFIVLRKKTTDATAATLLHDNTTRLTIPSGKVFAFVAKISGIKSDGSAVAFYTRKGAIKNVGGATSLVGSIETIGTDTEDNASTDVAITADDTNDALQINVTGIAAETWRWVAVVEGVEIGYGT